MNHATAGRTRTSRQVRFHGRGGQGVKLACRIVSRTGFLRGLNVQDSPLYGAERRGAPVAAFVRFAVGPILERGYIETPDVLVVMDTSLLTLPEAAVLGGVDASTILLANSTHSADDLRRRFGLPGPVAALDVSSMALELLGQHVLSAPMAGFAVRATGLAEWDVLEQAVRVELAEVDVGGEHLERNLAATRRAFDAGAEIAAPPRPPKVAVGVVSAFRLPRLAAAVAAPSIAARGTSALRHTDGWRVFRPLVDLQRCTGCLLCFALCPEGAIGLDDGNRAVVDYDHCKGCLVCVNECPTGAIAQVREEAA